MSGSFLSTRSSLVSAPDLQGQRAGLHAVEEAAQVTQRRMGRITAHQHHPHFVQDTFVLKTVFVVLMIVQTRPLLNNVTESVLSQSHCSAYECVREGEVVHRSVFTLTT